MADILTSSKWNINEETLAALKAAGVDVKKDFPTDEELDLKEPTYGETVLGNLDDSEFGVFVELWRAQNELIELAKNETAKRLHAAADKVRASDIDEFVRDMQTMSQKPWELDSDGRVAWRLQNKINLTKALFYWHINEKFDTHEFKCGVRSKRRIVKIERRF